MSGRRCKTTSRNVQKRSLCKQTLPLFTLQSHSTDWCLRLVREPLGGGGGDSGSGGWGGGGGRGILNNRRVVVELIWSQDVYPNPNRKSVHIDHLANLPPNRLYVV